MKGRVTVLLVALNTRAYVAFTTNVTLETPASFVDVFNTNDGLKEDSVSEVNLRYPNGANHVCPLALIGLLERAVFVRTQDTADGRRWRLYAFTTQPLTLGYIWHSVAFLMHGQITHVTKQNQVTVHAFTVQTNTTQSIFIFNL
jgi:hypothetical protein